MSNDPLFKEIEPELSAMVPSAGQVANGIPVPPIRLLEIYPPDDWEIFTEEWLSFHRANCKYHAVRRYAGPGDLGLDLVGFVGPNGFDDLWDSFQCKHYDHALSPEDVCAEVGKLIYHSFNKTPPFNRTYSVPRKHVFVSPRGAGITVGRWLKDPQRFKKEIKERWANQCVRKIGAGIEAPLEGELLSYVEAFDFSIFGDTTGAELIEEHSKTVFYSPRFGGGLPARGETPEPPAAPSEHESVYLRKIFDVYGEKLGKPVRSPSDFISDPKLSQHYNRQRVLFYSAEALRNFARDRTPQGTFTSLQDDIYNGVVDVCERDHETALDRLRQVITAAGSIDVGGNGLASVTRVADKQGVCHQLANDEKLAWVSRND